MVKKWLYKWFFSGLDLPEIKLFFNIYFEIIFNLQNVAKIVQLTYTLYSSYPNVSVQFSLVAQSCPTLCDHRTAAPRLPCPSPTPGAYSSSCLSSRWCHPTISSSVILFSSCLQFFPASGSFQMSQLFASGGQSIGVSASASVPPMNI